MFVEPDVRQLQAAKEIGAPVVELHTGSYRERADPLAREIELDRINRYGRNCGGNGVECHAGHGLTLKRSLPLPRYRVSWNLISDIF